MSEPATPPTPESDAHREARESVVCKKCYGLTSCWCPPTPDLAAVRLRAKVEKVMTALMRDADLDDDQIQRELDDGKHGLLRDLDALLRPAPLPADVRAMVERERAAWIDGAAWASMDNDEISVGDIEAAANKKFGPGAAPSDEDRMDWLAQQATPHHGVILCASSQPNEPWASVQRVDQFHNPHKVQWCVEGGTLRDAIERAMAEVPTLTLAPDDPERDRSLAAVSRPAEARGEPVPTTLRNALRDPNYTPYCGDGSKCQMPRARKTGYLTFECPECGFKMDLRPALERLLAHPAPSGGEGEA